MKMRFPRIRSEANHSLCKLVYESEISKKAAESLFLPLNHKFANQTQVFKVDSIKYGFQMRESVFNAMKNFKRASNSHTVVFKLPKRDSLGFGLIPVIQTFLNFRT